jgi:hypothetical protein
MQENVIIFDQKDFLTTTRIPESSQEYAEALVIFRKVMGIFEQFTFDNQDIQKAELGMLIGRAKADYGGGNNPKMIPIYVVGNARHIENGNVTITQSTEWTGPTLIHGMGKLDKWLKIPYIQTVSSIGVGIATDEYLDKIKVPASPDRNFNLSSINRLILVSPEGDLLPGGTFTDPILTYDPVGVVVFEPGMRGEFKVGFDLLKAEGAIFAKPQEKLQV